MELLGQILHFIFLCPLVLGFIPAVFPLAQLIAALVAGTGAGVGIAGAAGAFGGGGGAATPPIDPYTGQIMGIDPNTGLNQRVVDSLWSQPQPEGYQYAGTAADYVDANGLPKWIVNRLEWAKTQNANWFDFFKQNPIFTGALPAELVQLLSAPWGSIPSDVPTQTPQGVPNEGQEVYNPAPQEPQVFPEADISTTVIGQQAIPPELVAAGVGGGLMPWMLPGGTPNIVNQPQPGGIYSNLSPIQDPSSGGMYSNLSPVTPPTAPMLPGLGVPVIPSPLPTQLDPYTQGDMPYFYAEGVAHGDQIQPVPSTIGTTLTPGAVPPLPTVPSNIPTTLSPGTVPPVNVPPTTGASVNYPNTPEIPNIPLGGGGGIPAAPAGFPVVGGGPLIQTVFGPVPLPQAPPSIIDFLRRR